MTSTPKEYFLLVLLVLFLIAATSWIVFARFTMSRIEKRMSEKGFLNVANWDGIGARVILYAYALVLPQKYAQRIESRLINSISVKSYSDSKDRISGIIFLISSNTLMVSCFIGWVIWGKS